MRHKYTILHYIKTLAFGGEHWITRSTSGMSRPRAATSVAMRTW